LTIPVKLPKEVLNLFPTWEYRCPCCSTYVESNVSLCPNCKTPFNENKWRVPPRFLKNPEAMSEYAHKVLVPKLTQKQRELLFQYFTEIFSDGFESGDLSAWDVSFADDGCSVVGSDTTHPHHGSYNLKATIYAGCSARWAAAGKQLNGVYNPVHIRAMNCVFENEPDTSDTYRVMSFSNDERGAAAAYAGIKYYNSAWRWWVYVRDNGSFVNYYGGTVNFDTEYCMEFCVYRDSSTGYARLYVNGSLEVQATGLNNSDRNLNYANVGFTYSAAGSSQGIFYADCVVVADTYIGPEEEGGQQLFTLINMMGY